LHKEGTISFADSSKEKGRNVIKIYPGHYNLYTFAEILEDIAEKNKYNVEFKKNTPRAIILGRNPNAKQFINIDTDLADLFTGGIREIFGNRSNLQSLFFFNKSPSYPTTYFVHCNLVDREQNLFNSKKSDLLAKFDVKGKPYEKVTYLSSPQEVFRECSTDNQVNSITLSVKDKNGKLFDFKGLDMEFELELN
jgi:hypothetical protein